MAWFESHLNSGGGSGGSGNYTDSAWDGSIIVGCYVETDGHEVPYDPSWSATDYLDISGQTNVYRSGGIEMASYNCWYDENKTFISFFQRATVNAVPNNAKYVRYSGETGYMVGKIFTEATS